jgi:hypothetical protein
MDPAPTNRSIVQFRPGFAGGTFLIVILLLAVVEAVIRVGRVQDALPIRTHYHEPGVVRRVESLDRVLKQYGHIDVLFAGSSVVRCNIRPIEFDSLVADNGRLVSFNVGMSGLWPRAVHLYLKDLWLPKARPRMVVQGIRYGELVDSPRARKFDDIVHGSIESAWTDGGTGGRLKAAAYEQLHLLQYRGTWPSWLMRYRNGTPNEYEEDELRVVTDPRGWTPRTPTLDVVLAAHRLDKEKPNPAIVDLRSIAEPLDDIKASARESRRMGAEYVLLNVPEHAFRWSGPDGRARYATYLNTLRTLADSEGFSFVDVTGGDPEQFAAVDEYSDYHHMSPRGAERFTRLIAAEFASRVHALLAEPAGPSKVAVATP